MVFLNYSLDMNRTAGAPLLVLIIFVVLTKIHADGYDFPSSSSVWNSQYYSHLKGKESVKSSKAKGFSSSHNFASYSQSSEICSVCRKQDELSARLKQFLTNTGNNAELEYFEENRVETYGFNNMRKMLNKLKVERFLKKYQKELEIRERQYALVAWEKNVNLTEYNTQKSIEASLQLSAWKEKKRRYARNNLTLSGLSCSQNKMLKSVRRTSDMKEEAARKESLRLSSQIQEIYSNAKLCNGTTCFSYEPGLIGIFEKSRDYDKLLWAWKGWRDAIGPKIRKDWIRRFELNNMGANENGYSDLGAYWRDNYHVDDFQARIDALWRELEPLYKQLHAYVRRRLHEAYGDRVSLTGPIPAHLLGNMWAQQWGSIYDLCTPYKDVGEIEIDKGMKRMNYTVNKIFRVADDFYQSIGLPPMPESFWEKSMFVRPENRSVVCYASASNLGKTDVRVKMCSSVNSGYLYVAHHEMGHCQYYLAYNQHQPELFRNGANSGFHEAIGDTAALSVINPTHLLSLGLIEKDENPKDTDKKHINFLLHRAMDKLAFFPSALTIDRWRWKVFSGEIPPEKLNEGWWKERTKLGGIAPPIARSEKDFDPGSKYHIANNVPYIRYFLSHMLQFQFFEAMCNLAGHKGDLFLCDVTGSKKAGKKFAEMLQTGSSKHWEDILHSMAGSCRTSVGAVKKYFQPLLKWLVEENKKLGNTIGWE